MTKDFFRDRSVSSLRGSVRDRERVKRAKEEREGKRQIHAVKFNSSSRREERVTVIFSPHGARHSRARGATCFSVLTVSAEKGVYFDAASFSLSREARKSKMGFDDSKL